MTAHDHVYSITQLAGSSERSLEKAIENAVETASRSLRNLAWFEVMKSAVTSRTAASPTTRSC